jgi:hypothetical protein
MRTEIITLIVMMALLSGCTGVLTGGAIRSETIDCSLSTDIAVLTINQLPQACYRESSIYFTVENTGSSDIAGFMVTLQADYDLTMKLLGYTPPGDTADHSVTFGSQKLEDVRSMTIRPILRSGSGSIICDAAAIKMELEKC